MIEIIDNFLPEEEFKSIQSFMMGDNFPWFFINYKVIEGDGHYQFAHMFYQDNLGALSEYIDLWSSFMTKVKAKQCFRIKANMTLKTLTPEKSEFHTDYIELNRDIKTAILYINTNDGYTEFKNGVIVSSVANRACIFDSNFEHRGVGHTLPDPHRIVVNFNYE